MLAGFWEAAGGKLADRWATVSIPALVFWLGGLAAWTYHRGGLHTLASRIWLERQTSAVQVAVILTVLLSVAASGIVVERAATPVLRLLEGYWPSWTGPLRRRLTKKLARRGNAEAHAWQEAYARVQAATPTAEDLAVYTRLERRRRRRPATAGHFQPTPIGNILRAAERRPIDKYGLDTVTVWPHLWLLLPEATRTELRAARASLDTAVVTATWGILFCAFIPFTWLAIPIGLAVTTIAVTFVMPARAQFFGELIEAAYDLHRTAVYQQLRWPLPANPQQEHTAGTQLTTYLLRGSDSATPTFTSDDIAVSAKRFEEAIHAAFVPPPLVSFSGAIGVSLTNARAVDDTDGRRVWRIPQDQECRLMVMIETGSGPVRNGPVALTDAPGLHAWEPLEVRGGRQADSIEVDVIVDAPFLEVANPRGHFQCPTTGGVAAYNSELRATQVGPYDLRVTLLSAGRVIQAVPVEIIVPENR